jgi:hypothetical protein
LERSGVIGCWRGKITISDYESPEQLNNMGACVLASVFAGYVYDIAAAVANNARGKHDLH